MKQTRIIRISFLVCAALVVVAFWAGFYFGENSSSAPEQILTASDDSEKAEEPEYEVPFRSVSETEDEEKDDETTAEDANQTVESMKGIHAEKYYLKPDDEYLAVYHSDTDSLYFETDIKLSDLPEDLQAEAMEGIPFTGLEELYSFLENYSS